MEAKAYQCENCGSKMTFDAATQTLKCSSCGHQIEILNEAFKVIEHPLTRDKLVNVRPGDRTSTTMECKGCGAKIEVDPACTALDCPYCGSVYVLAKVQEDTIPPDGIVPFRISYEQVGEIFREWLAKRKFAPSALKNLYQSGKLTGLYLPFYTFDASVNVYYTARGGKHRTEQRRGSDGKMHTYTHTDWYPTSGQFSNSFDDILVRATEHMSGALMDAVEPFGTQRAASWSPDYFAGYRAECFTKDLSDCHQSARAEMDKKLGELARRDVLQRFDAVSDLKLRSDYARETFKYLMLPVYTTSYRFRSEMYQVVINGETGEISGTYPKSAVKIILFIVIIIAAVILVYQLSGH